MILTQNRMQDIDNAIIQYLNVNGVLPCPAKLTDAPDSATFGRSLTDIFACRHRLFRDFRDAGNVYNVRNQARHPHDEQHGKPSSWAPFLSALLNLPDQEIADAWGDRFVYSVTDADGSGQLRPYAGIHFPWRIAITTLLSGPDF